MNRDQFNELLDDFQRRITDITDELERDLIVALRDEFLLRYPTDNDDVVTGRERAVRGMASRLGLSEQLERSIK